MSRVSDINRSCPYLGLADDADTSLAFPSVWNNCHRSRPPVAPKLKHQAEFCLKEDHRQCPVYLSEQIGPLPKDLCAPRNRATQSKSGPWLGLALAVIALAIVAVLIWSRASNGSFAPLSFRTATPTASLTPFPTSTPTALPTATASLIPSPTYTFTASPMGPLPAPTFTWTPTATFTFTATSTSTSTSTSSPTLTWTPSWTPTPTVPPSKHQLDMVIGTDHKFVIHRVMGGESLNQFAYQYRTSTGAILTVNHNLKTPVQSGMLVVIPDGFTDVSNLPSFDVYQVQQVGITVEALAQQLGVDPTGLEYYNAVGAGEEFQSGDWVLVPSAKPPSS